MFFVTIVCRCGNHNHVHDDELERAICSRCDSPLLRPSPPKSALPQVEAAVDVRVPATKPILAS